MTFFSKKKKYIYIYIYDVRSIRDSDVIFMRYSVDVIRIFLKFLFKSPHLQDHGPSLIFT